MRSHRRPARQRARLAALGIVAAATAVLTLLPAGAPSDAATGPAQAATGRVTGRVVDATGAPVAGAMVNVLGPKDVPEHALDDGSPYSTTTRADGRFAVPQNPKGYLVQVCQPSLAQPWSCEETVTGVDYVITYAGPGGVTDSWLLQHALFAAGAADRALGTIEVGRPSQITGRIGGASFSALQLHRMDGSVAFRMRTDADGDYAFKGLVAGRYYVSAGGDGWLPWTSDPVVIDPDHPAVVDAVLDPGAALRGRAVSAARGAGNVPVLVERADGTPVAATRTRRSGAFRVQGLTPGTYRLSVAPGSAWAPSHTTVVVTRPAGEFPVELPVAKGAQVALRVVEHGRPAAAAVDELRRGGRPYATLLNADGTIVYTGLPRGRYTVVVAGEDGYGTRSFRVAGPGATDLGKLRLTRRFLTVHGRTAPGAVVEATTGDLCPPDEAPRYGAFQELVRADDAGRYAIGRLVPGTYMVAADAYPANYAPRCRPDIVVDQDTRVDVPLDEGEQVSGRLVYADTGQPVITPLSYELLYPAGSPTNPVEEHPARSRTRGASGSFTIRGLAAGQVTGRLATEADGNFTEAKFFPVHPYEDGTPYWLDAEPQQVVVGAGDGDLGDIPLTLHTGS